MCVLSALKQRRAVGRGCASRSNTLRISDQNASLRRRRLPRVRCGRAVRRWQARGQATKFTNPSKSWWTGRHQVAGNVIVLFVFLIVSGVKEPIREESSPKNWWFRRLAGSINFKPIPRVVIVAEIFVIAGALWMAHRILGRLPARPLGGGCLSRASNPPHRDTRGDWSVTVGR